MHIQSVGIIYCCCDYIFSLNFMVSLTFIYTHTHRSVISRFHLRNNGIHTLEASDAYFVCQVIIYFFCSINRIIDHIYDLKAHFLLHQIFVLGLELHYFPPLSLIRIPLPAFFLSQTNWAAQISWNLICHLMSQIKTATSMNANFDWLVSFGSVWLVYPGNFVRIYGIYSNAIWVNSFISIWKKRQWASAQLLK